MLAAKIQPSEDICRRLAKNSTSTWNISWLEDEPRGMFSSFLDTAQWFTVTSSINVLMLGLNTEFPDQWGHDGIGLCLTKPGKQETNSSYKYSTVSKLHSFGIVEPMISRIAMLHLHHSQLQTSWATQAFEGVGGCGKCWEVSLGA